MRENHVMVLQAIKEFGQALCPDNSHAARSNRHALHIVIAATTPDDPKLYEIYRDLIGVSKTRRSTPTRSFLKRASPSKTRRTGC